jgi:hypothetical protein
MQLEHSMRDTERRLSLALSPQNPARRRQSVALIAQQESWLDRRVRKQAHPRGGEKTQLHIAAERGLCLEAHQLLRDGAEPALEDEHGNTPMHLAVECGRLEMMRLLVEEGCLTENELVLQNFAGQTPLHLASLSPDHRCLELMLDLIACPGKDPNELNCLHSAGPSLDRMGSVAHAATDEAGRRGGCGHDLAHEQGGASRDTSMSETEAAHSIA